jgi:thiamine-phosphate pyrophosphorylase
MRVLADCRLYSFVDAAYLRGRDPVEIGRALCAGGADVVQLRAKHWAPEEVRRVGKGLCEVCRAAGVWFVVNDFPEVAVERHCATWGRRIFLMRVGSTQARCCRRMPAPDWD